MVNFELPHVAGDYVHRIGRTARAGETGHAVSLVCVDERELLRDIERLLKCGIEKEIIRGFEPDPRIEAEPIENGRSQPKAGRGAGPRKQNRGGPPKGRSGKRGRSSGRRRRAS